VLDAICGGMQFHLGSEPVQKLGCAALCAFAAGTFLDYFFDLSWDGDMDGYQAQVSAIVGGMQRHADSKAVQEQGRAALRQIVAGDSAGDDYGCGASGGHKKDVERQAQDANVDWEQAAD
jgi:hypothetical protein